MSQVGVMFLALCSVLTTVSAGVLPDPHELIKDTPKFNSYISCLEEKGPCESWVDEVKRFIPAALMESCKGCPDEHKHFYRVITIYIIENKPELYKRLLSKFDKDGLYEKKMLAFIYGTD